MFSGFSEQRLPVGEAAHDAIEHNHIRIPDLIRDCCEIALHQFQFISHFELLSDGARLRELIADGIDTNRVVDAAAQHLHREATGADADLECSAPFQRKSFFECAQHAPGTSIETTPLILASVASRHLVGKKLVESAAVTRHQLCLRVDLSFSNAVWQ